MGPKDPQRDLRPLTVAQGEVQQHRPTVCASIPPSLPMRIADFPPFVQIPLNPALRYALERKANEQAERDRAMFERYDRVNSLPAMSITPPGLTVSPTLPLSRLPISSLLDDQRMELDARRGGIRRNYLTKEEIPAALAFSTKLRDAGRFEEAEKLLLKVQQWGPDEVKVTAQRMLSKVIQASNNARRDGGRSARAQQHVHDRLHGPKERPMLAHAMEREASHAHAAAVHGNRAAPVNVDDPVGYRWTGAVPPPLGAGGRARGRARGMYGQSAVPLQVMVDQAAEDALRRQEERERELAMERYAWHTPVKPCFASFSLPLSPSRPFPMLISSILLPPPRRQPGKSWRRRTDCNARMRSAAERRRRQLSRPRSLSDRCVARWSGRCGRSAASATRRWRDDRAGTKRGRCTASGRWRSSTRWCSPQGDSGACVRRRPTTPRTGTTALGCGPTEDLPSTMWRRLAGTTRASM